MRTRTSDLPITSRLLYQLSYDSIGRTQRIFTATWAATRPYPVVGCKQKGENIHARGGETDVRGELKR